MQQRCCRSICTMRLSRIRTRSSSMMRRSSLWEYAAVPATKGKCWEWWYSRPPGAKRVSELKSKCGMLSRLSRKDRPQSLAPTTTILAFTGIFVSLSSFFATIERAFVLEPSRRSCWRSCSRKSSSVGSSFSMFAKHATFGGFRSTFLSCGGLLGATCNSSRKIGETVLWRSISAKSTVRPMMRSAPCCNRRVYFWNSGLTT
mmetsp:Transcript_129960/g.417145  ORF Transcript_129960/g.417145 Transcript_129960/m.417145 type:complete len:202 (+) Transcript_129960:1863-2468(+)